MVDDEAIQHLHYLRGGIPGFGGDPAVGGEQTGRVAVAVHRDGDQMRQRFIACRPRIGGGVSYGGDPGGHSLRTQESVKVAVFADFAAMRVVVILRMGFAVVHIVIGVVIEFVKCLAPVQRVAQHFTHQVQSGFLQDVVTLQNLQSGLLHGVQLRRRQPGKIRCGYRLRCRPGRARWLTYHFLPAQGFLAPQGVFAAQGFWAAHGFFAAQGFFAAHGFIACCFFALHGCLPAHGFFPAQGFSDACIFERAAHGLAAPQGAAMAAPLMAAASAPEESRVLAI